MANFGENFFEINQKEKVKIRLLVIIKGRRKAMVGGKRPRERAKREGKIATGIVAQGPILKVEKNKTAFTKVPVIHWF